MLLWPGYGLCCMNCSCSLGSNMAAPFLASSLRLGCPFCINVQQSASSQSAHQYMPGPHTSLLESAVSILCYGFELIAEDQCCCRLQVSNFRLGCPFCITNEPYPTSPHSAHIHETLSSLVHIPLISKQSAWHKLLPSLHICHRKPAK